jgi:hypothetical protein
LPEAGRDGFERAVGSYELRAPALASAPLRIASASLARTGLVLLGETHGVSETPAALGALARELGARALALEWSFDELGGIVEDALATGRFDLDRLWELAGGGDVFAGDGRFTAGHVRVVEELVAAGELDQVILVDRLGSDGRSRERDMAARLLEGFRPGLGTLAVVGHGHALRGPAGADDAQPMFAHVEEAVPGVRNGSLSFSSGTCHFHGEAEVSPIDGRTDAVFELGVATPAVVPAR